MYATGSSFGPAGADSGREGADLSGQAAGGLISTTGRSGGERTPIGATIADHIASQNLVAGIVAALLARTRTGRGQRVDCSLLGGQIWAQASEYMAYLMTGSVSGPANGGHPLIPGLYGIFRTSDGWIAVVGIVGALREEFYKLVGRPELAAMFPQPLYSEADKAALFPLLDEAFGLRTTREWCEALAAAGMRHAPVRDHAEVVSDPSVWENGYIVRVEGDQGEVPVPGSPVRFSETPARAAARAPELGQHTEEVLLEVGYTWEQIGELSASGAI